MDKEQFIKKFSYRSTQLGVPVNPFKVGISQYEWQQLIKSYLPFQVVANSTSHLDDFKKSCESWCLSNCTGYWCNHNFIQTNVRYPTRSWLFRFEHKNDALRFKLWKVDQD